MTFLSKHLNLALRGGAFLMLALAPALRGSTITTPIFLNTGAGTVSGSVNTPVPNNGHIGGVSPNTLTLNEDINAFWFSAQFGLSTANGATGSTEYFVTKNVTNDTGSTWTDFTIDVGCGVDGGSSCGGGAPLTLVYDVPPTLTTPGILSSQNSYSMNWSGLNVAPGQSVTLTFSMYTCPACSGSWEIFQDATGAAAPEPAAAVL